MCDIYEVSRSTAQKLMDHGMDGRCMGAGGCFWKKGKASQTCPCRLCLDYFPKRPVLTEAGLDKAAECPQNPEIAALVVSKAIDTRERLAAIHGRELRNEIRRWMIHDQCVGIRSKEQRAEMLKKTMELILIIKELEFQIRKTLIVVFLL